MLCFFLIETTWFCSKCLNCTFKTHHRTALLQCLPFKATFIEPAATKTDSIQLSDNPASPNFYPEFQEKTLLCEILIIQLLCNPSTLCVVDVWSWIVAHLPFIRGRAVSLLFFTTLAKFTSCQMYAYSRATYMYITGYMSWLYSNNVSWTSMYNIEYYRSYWTFSCWLKNGMAILWELFW